MRTSFFLLVAAAGLAACAPQPAATVGVGNNVPARDTGSNGSQDASGQTVGVSSAAPGLGQQGDSQGYQPSAPGRTHGVSVYVPRGTSLRGSEGYQVPARPAATGTASPSVQ